MHRAGATTATILLSLLTLTLASCATSATTADAPSATAASTPEPADSTAPPTPSADAVDATCENTVSKDYLDDMADRGWKSVALADTDSAFADLPGGAPAGSITCRWSADPTVGTDTVEMTGWAPLVGDGDGDAVVAALTADGWQQRTEGETQVVWLEGDGPHGSGELAAYAVHADWIGYGSTSEIAQLVTAPGGES